jgi:hypothetical protein
VAAVDPGTSEPDLSGVRPAAVRSTDDGSTWTRLPLPAGDGVLNGVSCAGSVCEAVGERPGADGVQAMVLVSGDAGVTWHSTQAPPGTLTALAGVVCTGAGGCVVVGATLGLTGNPRAGVIYRTPNALQPTWQAATLPGNISDLAGIACPTASDCYAVGAEPLPASLAGPLGDFTTTLAALLASRDGGTTWVAQDVPEPGAAGGESIAALDSIICASANSCVAGGGESVSDVPEWGGMVSTDDGGAQWTATPIPATVLGALTGVACVAGAADACWAVGGRMLISDVVPRPAPVTTQGTTTASHGETGFPWWVLVLALAALGAAGVAIAVRRRAGGVPPASPE